MIQKITQPSQNGTGLGYEFLVVNFYVISRNLASELPACVHCPFPVKRRFQQAAGLPAPGEGPEALHFHERQRYIPSVAHDVYEHSIWQVSLDLSYMKEAVGVVDRPSLHPLAVCDFVHNNADEVAPVAAFRQ